MRWKHRKDQYCLCSHNNGMQKPRCISPAPASLIWSLLETGCIESIGTLVALKDLKIFLGHFSFKDCRICQLHDWERLGRGKNRAKFSGKVISHHTKMLPSMNKDGTVFDLIRHIIAPARLSCKWVSDRQWAACTLLVMHLRDRRRWNWAGIHGLGSAPQPQRTCPVMRPSGKRLQNSPSLWSTWYGLGTACRYNNLQKQMKFSPSTFHGRTRDANCLPSSSHTYQLQHDDRKGQ